MGANGEIDLLIQRAAEREQAFDGVEADYSLEMSFGRRMVEPRKVTGHWAKSGSLSLIESEFAGPSASGAAAYSLRYASDGGTAKAIIGTPENKNGFVSDAGAGFARRMAVTPEHFVTALPFAVGSVRARLAGESTELSFTRSDGTTFTTVATRDARLAGYEVVETRNCLVVEIRETWSAGKRNRESVERLYFAEDLDYACVRFERGALRDGVFEARSRWTMSDFREVKDGLFVPFAAAALMRRGDGRARMTAGYRLEKLDFVDRFDDGFFEVDFPPGIQVHDRVVDVSYMSGGMTEEEIDFLAPESPELDDRPAMGPTAAASAEASAPAPAADGVEGEAAPNDRAAAVLMAIAGLRVAGLLAYCLFRRKPPGGGTP